MTESNELRQRTQQNSTALRALGGGARSLLWSWIRWLQRFLCGGGMTTNGFELLLAERGRAVTPVAKRRVVDRVCEAWAFNPNLRLGQLLDRALVEHDQQDRLYDIEDEVLAGIVESFARRRGLFRNKSA